MSLLIIAIVCVILIMNLAWAASAFLEPLDYPEDWSKK